jgi:small subunit ribosomal protein S4
LSAEKTAQGVEDICPCGRYLFAGAHDIYRYYFIILISREAQISTIINKYQYIIINMAKDLDPKCKKCRRAGERLFLKGDRCNTPKCAIVKRNYAPGFHGPHQRTRVSDYGKQLREKQKARQQYGMLEKQFKLSFELAKKKSGNTGDVFIQILESRFDNVIYRLGFASSRSQARQLINHGHFSVNDRRMSIPSYSVKTGDIIKIKNNKKEAKYFKNISESLKNKEVPGWLNLNSQELSAKVLHLPAVDQVQPNFNVQMIIEYYSR